MFGLFKKPKSGSVINTAKVKEEINALSSSSNGVYIKHKEIGKSFQIEAMIEKNLIGIASEEKSKKIPQTIVFLIIIDEKYPERPPNVLTKTNFSSPSLMDGRDLLKEICPKWNSHTKLIEIINGMVPFLAQVINSVGIKFYGEFHLGAEYSLDNFTKMIVNIFDVYVDDEKTSKSKDKKVKMGWLQANKNYQIVLTEDCFIVFEKYDNNNNGKIVYWSTLYAITDLQLNKKENRISINFYDDENNSEYCLKFHLNSILLFRESLVKKMKNLNVKYESQKLIHGQNQFKRLSAKEIKTMNIDKIEKNVKELYTRIKGGEISDYTVNTFTTLCGKAIEHFSQFGDDTHFKYLDMMKEILTNEKVNNIIKTSSNESGGPLD